MTFLSGGKRFATTNDATVDVWDVDSGRLVHALKGGGHMVRALVSAEKGVMVGGDRDGDVWIWRDAEERQRFGQSPVKHINSGGLALSSDSKVLFWPGKELSVVAADLATGKELRTYDRAFRDEASFRYLAVSGKFLATGSGAQAASFPSRQVNVYNIEDGKVLHTFPGAGPVAISPDQSFLACLVDDRNVGVFDMTTGKEKFRTRLTRNNFVLCVAISPDSKWVAFGGGDNTARIVNATTGEELFVLRHTDFVDSVAFSPNGQLLATGSRKGFVQLFSLETGKVIAGHGANSKPKHHLPPGTYSLSAAFDGDDQNITFFHDVSVGLKSQGRVMIVVLDDIAPKDSEEAQKEEAADDAGLKPTGGLRGGFSKQWRRRPAGQAPWLKPGRRFHGRMEGKDVIRFGFTSVRDGKLISLHFVGRPSENGATGKVYYLPEGKSAIEGKWELYNPNLDPLPVGPTLKGVPFGR